MRCVKCNNDFVAKRSDARFCSPACRVNASRDKDEVLIDNSRFEAKSVADLLPEKKSPEKLPIEVSSGSDELTMEELQSLINTKVPPIMPTNDTEPLFNKSHGCCDSCVELPTFGHFCPSKKCGCFQTNEEQEADILKLQSMCDHVEYHLARCTKCVAFVTQKKRTGEKNFLKKSKND